MAHPSLHLNFALRRVSLLSMACASAVACLSLVACGGGGSTATSSVANPGSPASGSNSQQPNSNTVAAALSATDSQTLVVVNNDLTPKSSGISACVDPLESNDFSAQAGFSLDLTAQSKALESLLNHARCLAGVSPLARDTRLDSAASGHANYSILNKSATHTQDSRLEGFTSSNPGQRMGLTAYPTMSVQKPEPFQWGEVLAKTGPVAREAHDGLMSAIYHRLAMLSPQVTDVGVGLKLSSSGKDMVSVMDMAATSLQKHGKLIVYPASGQQQVPVLFNSDLELPDPFPAQSIVGYPISVQVDRGSLLTVSKFELRDPAGKLIPSFVRAAQNYAAANAQQDTQLENNEAFLAATGSLLPNTQYTVNFVGTQDGVNVSKSWTFTTAALQDMAVAETNTVTVGAFTRIKLNGCSSSYTWRYTDGMNVAIHSNSWMQVKGVKPGRQWAEITDSCGQVQRIDFNVL